MINKTYLPHTYENQSVLREYGAKIAGSFGRQVHLIKGPGLWSRICNFFPSSQTMGYKAGEHLGLTYGAQWSNTTIDFVVRRFFQQETQPPSYWSWDGWKSLFFGATQATLAETLKLTLTPKALPYITLISGTVSAIALPTMICMISLTYQRVMFDPRQLQQLSKLTLDQLFTIDADTGRLRDAFGRLMSPEDMKDILAGAAKYDLICKLIDLCHEIDQKDCEDDELQEGTKQKLEELIKSYVITRSDGQFMFPDGFLCTAEEKEIIQQGITDLSRINPCQKGKKIRKFIRVLANHSLLPVETFVPSEKIGVTGCPKRIPALFLQDGQEWKNAIVRSYDGKYVITQDIGGKKKGTILNRLEMAKILADLKKIQDQKKAEQHKELDTLLKQPKKHAALINKLNQLNREEVKVFFKSYVKPTTNQEAVFPNGDKLSAKEWQKFQQDLALLPTKHNLKAKTAKMKNLITQVTAHLA